MSYNPQQPPPQGYPQQPQGYPQPGGMPPAPMAAGSPSFWKALTLSGQVSVIAGVVLLISFFLPWYSATATSGAQSSSASASGLNFAGALILFWLVPLAALAMIVLPSMGAARQGRPRRGIALTGAILALLLELLYLGIVGSISGNISGFGANVTAGPGFGFWLSLLATLAAGIFLIYGIATRNRTP